MATAIYQYDTLPPDRSFRLLHVCPGQKKDPLQCTLVTTALDRAPAYTALSYVWGDPSNTSLLTCAGVERTVTASLLGGLRHLRHPEDVRLIWADAICINQTNIKEKAHEANLMATIYDKVAEVFVWLGKTPLLWRVLLSKAYQTRTRLLSLGRSALSLWTARTVSTSSIHVVVQRTRYVLHGCQETT